MLWERRDSRGRTEVPNGDGDDSDVDTATLQKRHCIVALPLLITSAADAPWTCPKKARPKSLREDEKKRRSVRV